MELNVKKIHIWKWVAVPWYYSIRSTCQVLGLINMTALPETEKLVSGNWDLENSRLPWQLGAHCSAVSTARRGGAETIWQLLPAGPGRCCGAACGPSTWTWTSVPNPSFPVQALPLNVEGSTRECVTRSAWTWFSVGERENVQSQGPGVAIVEVVRQ